MYTHAHRQQLVELAKRSIAYGLEHKRAIGVTLSDYEEQLQHHRACFVTLHLEGQLRGCIGSLEARRPLVEDVAENAFAAAFRDPRFNPLRASELDALELSISVLTPSTEIDFDSQQDLIDQIRPGVDGLILQEGHHRGTFLPTVWEQLPQAEQFLRQLKIKAGLAPDYWSNDLRVSRYETESFT